MKALCNFWVGCYLNEFKTSCIASHMHYNNVSCILDVCLLYALLCAGRFGLGWAHDEFIFACHMFMHSHAYVPSIVYILIYQLLGTFLIVSLYFFLSLLLMLVASWHLGVNPLRPETLFILGHLLPLFLLTPFPLPSSSMMRRPNQTSLRTFHDAAFIQNAKSFCQICLTLTYPLSSTVGVGSHCVAPQSCALPWSYRSSTPICMDLTTLHLSLSLAFELCAW